LFHQPPNSVIVNSPPPASSPSPSTSPAPDLAPSLAPAPNPAPGPSLTPAPAPALEPLAPSLSPSSVVTPPISPSPLLTPSEGPRATTQHPRSNRHRILVVSAATGGSVLLFLAIAIFFWQSGKVSTVKPWATGLSGQLQRAFVTGVPKLKRSELEAACEDFSNVIGTSSLCTLYKGTLSSGVEIAVASIAVASAKDWSNSLENQFRKKIDTLSKVNHKNFVNLLGYCVGEEPFTRMMVFEYAPNGTLFEHLHIKESEHLDWPMRLRIAMGIAYCLDHMHQSTPALAHRNINSSSVYLTDDYAAKISDFAFSDEEGSSAGIQPIAQNNIYGFGVVLFEMITGRLPYSSGSDPVDDWASEYLSRAQNLQDMVDPTLETYREDQLQQIGGVIKLCANPDPRFRPSMYEVCVRMREITGIEPDGALPKVSPLWWAELEILSTEAS
ncbi:inactive receptor-like serine/threonine-protein kinase at2g40270, partial [Phtheirospermum japonicum]